MLQTRSVRERMVEWYDEAVRPWLPESLGGFKTIDVSDDDDGVDSSQAGHSKAE